MLLALVVGFGAREINTGTTGIFNSLIKSSMPGIQGPFKDSDIACCLPMFLRILAIIRFSSSGVHSLEFNHARLCFFAKRLIKDGMFSASSFALKRFLGVRSIAERIK